MCNSLISMLSPKLLPAAMVMSSFDYGYPLTITHPTRAKDFSEIESSPIGNIGTFCLRELCTAGKQARRNHLHGRLVQTQGIWKLSSIIMN